MFININLYIHKFESAVLPCCISQSAVNESIPDYHIAAYL